MCLSEKRKKKILLNLYQIKILKANKIISRRFDYFPGFLFDLNAVT